MKKQLTKKLFFKKYPYKIEMFCKGASFIRTWGVDKILKTCYESASDHPQAWQWRVYRYIDFTSLHEFLKLTRPHFDAGIKYRVEHNYINFFLDDEPTFRYLIKKLEPYIQSISEPASNEDLEFLIKNNRKVIVNELPHGKFKHKIVFKSNWAPGKGNTFVNWLKKYPEDDFKISETSLKYFTGEQKYCQNPFIYITEAKMLTMLQLFAGDNIKYIEEFVPRSTLLL